MFHFISASNIIYVLWTEVDVVGAARLGFSPEDAGTHSIRSGIAMGVYIVGVLNHTISDIGRWRFIIFIVYIQK